MKIFNHIYQNHIIPCIQNPTKINMEYALYLIDDSLEYLGQYLPVDVQNNFAQILIQNMSGHQYDLKQSAAYGLGLLATNTNPEPIKSLFPQTLKLLESEIVIKLQPSEQRGYYKSFFDNVVSAYGKIFNLLWN